MANIKDLRGLIGSKIVYRTEPQASALPGCATPRFVNRHYKKPEVKG